MTKNYYDILGIDRSAGEADIKKAYRTLAMKYHPDKNPDSDPELFKNIQEAYETLSDPKKKAAYDNPPEFHKSQNQVSRVSFTIHLSIEEVYNGCVRKLSITRKRTCKRCEGRGHEEGYKPPQCGKCAGRGVVLQQEVLLGIFARQSLITCPDCTGSGVTIPKERACESCTGNRVVPEKKLLEINIKPGTLEGTVIRLFGESDEPPNGVPGDVDIVIKENPSEKYTRMGVDIAMKLNISLADSLCGLSYSFKYLDNKVYTITTNQGEVIKPDDVREISDLGLPINGKRGKLIIAFSVTFPNSLTVDQVAGLKRIFPEISSQHNEGTRLNMKASVHRYRRNDKQGCAQQ